jgi:hypothetical protein
VLVLGVLIWPNSRFGLHASAVRCLGRDRAVPGIEGNNLVARKLARQGWRLSDVVEEARWPRPSAAISSGRPPMAGSRAAADAASAARPRRPPPIIGLFPEARGR